MILTEPLPHYIRQRLNDWRQGDPAQTTDRTLALVFSAWPQNTRYEQVLAKVVILNRLYSTNIFDPYTVTQHILDQQIDPRLLSGSIALVDELASVAFRKRTIFLLSFTSKYCAWHQPDHFQIFDSYVEWLLWKYQRTFKFAAFRKHDLRHYASFVNVVDQFRSHFGLAEFTRREIDKFLWYEGTTLWRAESKRRAGSEPRTE